MKTRITFFILALLALILLAVPVSAGRRARGTTARVSVASDGSEANGRSMYSPGITPNGRYVVFQSEATNLVAEDTNNTTDVFVHDSRRGVTERVSVASDGTQANQYSDEASIPADGRYVAFTSYANNLVPEDTNNTTDVFVYDRHLRTTERVSVAIGGFQGNAQSWSPSISADGRYIAFFSFASNLVESDTNGYPDIFVRDHLTGITERVSLAFDGGQTNYSSVYPSISADGRYVAFPSGASNLVVADTNSYWDVFVYDRSTGVTERVSIASDGSQSNGESAYYAYVGVSISGDGRFVAFQSEASNLVGGDTNESVDVFVHDRQLGITELVSITTSGNSGSDYSGFPSISADGRYVAFHSRANNLVLVDTNGYSDIFVRDRQLGVTELVSINSLNTLANGASWFPSISAQGRYITFSSWANNLVPVDTNGVGDIFVRDREGVTPGSAQ